MTPWLLALVLVLIGLDLWGARRGRSGHSYRRQRELARTPPAPSPSRLPRPGSSGWQRLSDDLLNTEDWYARGVIVPDPRPMDFVSRPIDAPTPDAALDQLLHECGWDQPVPNKPRRSQK